MRIGILSMQEVKNYGSFLQAYSLKKTIEALGHECTFLNIIPGKQIGDYKQGKLHKLKILIERLWGWDFVKRFKTIYQFQTRFSEEFLPFLGVKKGTKVSHYDIVVIGSDEVFNCAQKTWFGFSPQLYGEGIDADKVITYAASFGATTVEILQKLGLKNEVARMLGNLDQISVRDENSINTVNTLTGIKPDMHVDPVFLYDFPDGLSNQKHKSDYIVIYSYPGRMSDQNEIMSIQTFAKKKGLKLLSIGHYYPWCDDVVVPTPFEVLEWFRDAAYIVTDTFHGSVFSIKYNKPFAVIIREMNKLKLTSLLRQFGLESRVVSYMHELENVLESEIDYDPVNKQISLETQRSKDYLANNIF